MKKFLDPEFEYFKLTLRDVICESTGIDGDGGMIEEETPIPGEEDDGFGEE